MFLGEYQHTLDAKGRLSLPVKFRNQLAGSYVVVKGIEKCLYVFSPTEYEVFLNQLKEGGNFGKDIRDVRRFFTAGAKEDDLDSAGRISIPVGQREYAKLERDVAVIGNGDRVEIWDAVAWAAYNSEAEGRIEEMTSKLAELGIL
ncbi:MAG: division/cell wall cluster transcriptional repressor MraZ [Coriobacteriia bacterium]|nr:division/cell wall cluster transcriptional repressor MraZ [Coriobacteriia bacterium]